MIGLADVSTMSYSFVFGYIVLLVDYVVVYYKSKIVWSI